MGAILVGLLRRAMGRVRVGIARSAEQPENRGGGLRVGRRALRGRAGDPRAARRSQR